MGTHNAVLMPQYAVGHYKRHVKLQFSSVTTPSTNYFQIISIMRTQIAQNAFQKEFMASEKSFVLRNKNKNFSMPKLGIMTAEGQAENGQVTRCDAAWCVMCAKQDNVGHQRIG